MSEDDDYKVACTRYTALLEKRNKLRQLVARGVGGEKTAAANALEKMRVEFLEAKVSVLWQWIHKFGAT
jgi:uncharacterized protein YdcH (DUF465 family)